MIFMLICASTTHLENTYISTPIISFNSICFLQLNNINICFKAFRNHHPIQEIRSVTHPINNNLALLIDTSSNKVYVYMDSK